MLHSSLSLVVLPLSQRTSSLTPCIYLSTLASTSQHAGECMSAESILELRASAMLQVSVTLNPKSLFPQLGASAILDLSVYIPFLNCNQFSYLPALSQPFLNYPVITLTPSPSLPFPLSLPLSHRSCPPPPWAVADGGGQDEVVHIRPRSGSGTPQTPNPKQETRGRGLRVCEVKVQGSLGCTPDSKSSTRNPQP